MKKFTKIIAIMLTMLLVIDCTTTYASSKSIYYSGLYKKGKYAISLSQYTDKDSYKKGEICGTMTLTCEGDPVMYGVEHFDIVFDNAPVKKIGKNKYSVKDPVVGCKCDITVRKKSIKVKFKEKIGKNGTYKLKNRFYS